MGRRLAFRRAAAYVAKLTSAALAAALLAAGPAGAQEPSLRPTRYAVGLGVGNSYTADAGTTWALATAAALLDYERVAPHPAPDALALKLELWAGVAAAPGPRGVLAANALAQYEWEGGRLGNAVPYGEAGFGLIYTDFRREGQGLRFNFNPVAGVGFLFRDGGGEDRAFAAVRFHHVSNGGADDENTGINSVLLTAGAMFR